jgi:hypothetical protein
MMQIMWLVNLTPHIQEAIRYLLRVESRPDTVKESDVRRIAQLIDSGAQRGSWRAE